jgi:UDP-N-acetyl-D-glucosamine dehydrogenase
VGIAYKKNVDDTRESPGLKIMDLLRDQQAKVDFHDPLVATLPQTRRYATFAGERSVPFTQANISRYDAAIICTDHDAVDYRSLVAWSRLVIDTRNVLARNKLNLDRVVKA